MDRNFILLMIMTTTQGGITTERFEGFPNYETAEKFAETLRERFYELINCEIEYAIAEFPYAK